MGEVIMGFSLRFLSGTRKISNKLLSKMGFGIYRNRDLRGMELDFSEVLRCCSSLPVIIECPLTYCRWYGPTGLAYGKGSLHPYVQTLLQYLSGECSSYKNSALAYYWRNWRPGTLAKSLGIKPESAHFFLNTSPPLNNFMPWGGEDQLAHLMLAVKNPTTIPEEPPPGSKINLRHVGPKPDWFGELRLQHLINMHSKIATEGYRQFLPASLPHFRQHIVVDCMLRDSEVRFLVANGQHRASVLSVMGQESVPVLVNVRHSRGPSVIRREEAEQWLLVREGIISLADALDVFDRVFDGRQPHGFPTLMRAGGKGA